MPHEHGHEHGHGNGHAPYDKHMRHADWQHIWERQRSREEMARGWLRTLRIAEGSRLLDVGCGPGFVSLLAAGMVGAGGRVYALDRSAEALAFLRGQMAARGVSNTVPLEGSAHAIPLAEGSVSQALVAQMLHHDDDPRRILGEVLRVLEPGGLALVVEHDPAGSPESGPPPEERLPSDRVIAWLAELGYDNWRRCPAGEGRYGVLALKAPAR